MATATMYQSNSGTYTISCTYANMVTGAARCSTAVDASGGRYLDALLMVSADLQTGAVTGNDNAVYIYLYGKLAGALSYTDNASGADAAITLRDPNNFVGPFAISFATATGNPIALGGPWSVANAFGGRMPSEWGVVVYNKTNSLFGTAVNNQITYMKIWNVAE